MLKDPSSRSKVKRKKEKIQVKNQMPSVNDPAFDKNQRSRPPRFLLTFNFLALPRENGPNVLHKKCDTLSCASKIAF